MDSDRLLMTVPSLASDWPSELLLASVCPELEYLFLEAAGENVGEDDLLPVLQLAPLAEESLAWTDRGLPSASDGPGRHPTGGA